jgi:hypothetical protein
MNRTVRGWLLVVLCLVLVAGLALTGCSKKEKALQQPGLEFTQYIKGSTVDFDETTINTMSDSGGEAGFKYGIMKSVYYTLWDTNKDAVAQALFPAPYWRGDGVHTYYSYLTSADQTAVDTYIFGNYIPGKGLSAAEQAVVTTAVQGFFDRQQIDVAAARALTATSFYLTLYAKVGPAAAEGWRADIESATTGLYVGKAYADLTATEKQVVIAVADPAGLFYKWMVWFGVADGVSMLSFAGKHYSELSQAEKDAIEATIDAAATAQISAGATGFMNGVAAATYPTQAGQMADTMYHKAYSALDAVTEAPYVNGAVYAGLASGFADDAARATARANMAYYLKSLGYIASDSYSALNYIDKARVDQAVYGSLTFGTAKERDYVDLAAVPGAVLKFVAEMSDAVPIEQSMCYLKLNGQSCYFMPPNNTGIKVSYPTTTAAKGFKTDVEAGVKLETAFYRWLAKEKVKETASAALLIEQSVGEFYFTITNPNKYEITIDQIVFAFQTTAGASNTVIDGARQTVDSMYVPAEGEVTLKVVAPTRVYDLVSWLTIAGQAANARAYAAEVWSKIQAGTITWTYTADMKVSHGDDVQNYTYPE